MKDEEPKAYTELEKMYNEMMKKKSYCPHTDAISVDENGIYHMNCKMCGLKGMADFRSAQKLGWTPL